MIDFGNLLDSVPLISLASSVVPVLNLIIKISLANYHLKCKAFEKSGP